MCGIAGVLGGRDAEAVARRMTACILHRGPDGGEVAALADAAGRPGGAFSHRRLSIIDLSPGGHQPKRTPDGRYTLVFNGEIYNYRALREELRREGETFRSESDTEVLLLGWARHGHAFLDRLRGMFAFALWDRDEGCAWLARDPFGIKPLYVSAAQGGVLFASEVRAVLASERVPRRLAPDAVAAYLAAGSVPEPLTLVERVRSIPPGTVVRVAVQGGVAAADAPVAYTRGPWTGGEGERDPRAAAALVRAALRDSVEHHLVADVPVAFFLSGGIDSSAVVALASEVAGGELETFTVVFDEQEFSEAGPALAVARRFGTRHHEIPLSGEAMLASLPAAFAAMDQPSMDGLNTYVVSGAVRERGIKVVLSGLGGDEVFAGYPSFRRARRVAPLWGATAPLRRLAGSAASRVGGVRGEKAALLLEGDDPARAAYRASRTLLGDRLVRALTGRGAPSTLGAPPRGLPLLRRVSWYETHGYMRDTLLRDSDVFSMAHALELRVPFVDRGVVAASCAVDDALKLAPGASKPLLVAAVADLLPREVWDRPKQGFTLPFERWLRGALRDEVSRAFTPARLAGAGLRPAPVRRLWEGFLRGEGVGWSRPWALYTLVRWAEENGVGLEAAAAEASPEPVLAAG